MDYETTSLLNEFETAYTYLTEDTQALFFIIDEYFSKYSVQADFLLNYPIIQNSLTTLFKSMMLNETTMKEILNKHILK